jgi:putative hydrolase of the HAD superfamily
MSESTAVWFDLDGTLVQYEKGFDDIFGVLFEADRKAAFDTYSSKLFRALDEGVDDPYVTAFEAVVAEHDVERTAEELAEDYIENELDATTVTEQTHDLLERLDEHVTLGVISNGTGDVQRRKLEEHDLADVFEEIVISSEVDTRKPGAKIFKLAADRVDAETHYYVGDTHGEDIKPARQAGFEQIHVRNDSGSTMSVDQLDSLAAFTALFD